MSFRARLAVVAVALPVAAAALPAAGDEIPQNQRRSAYDDMSPTNKAMIALHILHSFFSQPEPIYSTYKG